MPSCSVNSLVVCMCDWLYEEQIAGVIVKPEWLLTPLFLSQERVQRQLLEVGEICSVHLPLARALLFI